MSSWQLQDAKTHLSALIEDAHTKGPQIITRHGTERAAVISIEDYRERYAHEPQTIPKPNFVEFLRSFPKLEDDDPFFEALRRDVDPERDIGL